MRPIKSYMSRVSLSSSTSEFSTPVPNLGNVSVTAEEFVVSASRLIDHGGSFATTQKAFVKSSAQERIHARERADCIAHLDMYIAIDPIGV